MYKLNRTCSHLLLIARPRQGGPDPGPYLAPIGPYIYNSLIRYELTAVWVWLIETLHTRTRKLINVLIRNELTSSTHLDQESLIDWVRVQKSATQRPLLIFLP
jgi:hypothetical protein